MVSCAQALPIICVPCMLGAVKLRKLGRLGSTSSTANVNVAVTLNATALELISGVNTYV